MKFTLYQALDMIERGESPKQYEARLRKLRRYCDERDSLEDAIALDWEPGDERLSKKIERLEKVKLKIKELE